MSMAHDSAHWLYKLRNSSSPTVSVFLRQITARDRRRYLGDIATLSCEISRHHIHVVGKVLPCSRNSSHVCLPTQLPFAANLPGYASHFGRKRTKLINHRVDRVFELQDLTSNVHGDFFR